MPTVFTPTRRTAADRLACRPHAAGALLGALRAFLQDDEGQDLIEYGLLSAFIGIVTIAVWASIQGNLETAYRGYDTDVQNLWQSPDPGGS